MNQTIKAIDIREGQRVSAIHYQRVSDHIRKRFGRYPKVIEADYQERGENDLPTVYLVLSDDRGGAYCLSPDDTVTVEGGAP